MRDARELLDALPGVIEFMVAERGGAEAEQVGDFIDGPAAEKRGDGSALREVAGL